MLRHHTGTGRRQVIPADWAEAHQPAVEGTMVDATVALRDPSAPATSTVWSDELEQWVSVPAGTYWAGGARIQMLNQQGRQPVAAEDQEAVASYLVAVPAVVEAVEGHRVKVVVSADPLLTGRELRVVTVARGSQRFERDLYCELTD